MAKVVISSGRRRTVLVAVVSVGILMLILLFLVWGRDDRVSSLRSLDHALTTTGVVDCTGRYFADTRGAPPQLLWCFSMPLERRLRPTRARTVQVPDQASTVFMQVFDSEEERERSLSAFRDMAVQWHSDEFDPQIGGTTWDFSRPWSFLVVGDNWLVALHDEDAAAQVVRAVGGELLRLPSPNAARSERDIAKFL